MVEGACHEGCTWEAFTGLVEKKDLYDDHLAFIPIQVIFGPCVHVNYVIEDQGVLLISSVRPY